MRNIENGVADWLKAGIINDQSAQEILNFEKQRKLPDSNTPMVIFAILGSVLVALGISLMVAENWDNIPKTWKIVLSFCPIILGHILLLTGKFKFPDSVAWREAPSAFLFLTTGATLAMLSQVFQLQGTTAQFILLWLLLVTPIMFLTKSNTSFLLYILLASWYAYLVYWQKGASDIHYLWFAAAFLSYFVWRILKVPNHAIGLAAGWLIPISLTLFLGNLFMEPTVEGNSAGGWAFVGYALLFQCFINVFTLEWPFENKSWKIGFASIGFVGSMVLLYLFSFQFFAKQVVEIFNPQYLMHSYKALSTLALLLLLYATLVFYIVKKVSSPVLYVFPIFSLILCLSGFNYHLGQIMMNVFILAIAILFIVKGFSLKNLYQLNMGLLIFSLLVIFRFFDFNLSFFIRGISFLLLGAGFFIANRVMLKSRKEGEA